MTVALINWNGTVGSTPGDFSGMITYANGDTLYDSTAGTFTAGTVMYKINEFLTARGWEFVNNTNAASGGGTAGRYCYKAANLPDANNDPSWKYIQIDLTTSGKLFLQSWETITVDSSAPINMATYSNTHSVAMAANTSRVVSASGKLWIGASARHLIIQGNTGLQYGNQVTTYNDSGPIGVFELTRTGTFDIVSGYPKHVWLSTGMFGYTNATNTPVVPCRWRSTFTGTLSLYGAGGYTNGTSAAGSLIMPNALNANTGKPSASSVCVLGQNASIANNEVLGCMMNFIAVTRAYGSPIGEDIIVPVSSDPNFGNEKFYDPTGTPTSYWLLGGFTVGVVRLAVPK